MTTDPIADMLTRIRNANTRYHSNLELPSSKLKIKMVGILKKEGYIKNYHIRKIDNVKKVLHIDLKYKDRDKAILGLKRISKPGLRVYANCDELPKVLNGLGIAIVSTSQGIMTAQSARDKKIGGEVLAYVW